jgi:hypothetical protein
LLSATFCHMLLTPRMAKADRVKVVMPRLARVRLAPMVRERAPSPFQPLCRGKLDVWGIGGIITLVPCNRPGA